MGRLDGFFSGSLPDGTRVKGGGSIGRLAFKELGRNKGHFLGVERRTSSSRSFFLCSIFLIFSLISFIQKKHNIIKFVIDFDVLETITNKKMKKDRLFGLKIQF